MKSFETRLSEALGIGLSAISEDGYWDVVQDHPGKLGGSNKKRKKRLSFLLHPEDRETFFKHKKKRYNA